MLQNQENDRRKLNETMDYEPLALHGSPTKVADIK
jgi:hypothetical protein